MIGFFSAAARLLQSKYPRIRFRWGINPELRPLAERDFPACFAAPYERDGEKYDLIISLTGTNTAINAALGIPMLVLLPFNDPGLIPFTGLFGLISDIPFGGRLFKKLLLQSSLRKMRYISIPNLKAGRKIVPELRGFLTPEQVAGEAERLLLNIAEREQMRRELPVFIGKPGAQNIADYFEEIL
jgi:lipid-A-disaccharide synthase